MEDVFTIIASYLDIHDIYSCMRVCSQLYTIMNKEIVWHVKCIEYSYDLLWIQNYKEQFRVCHVLDDFLNSYGAIGITQGAFRCSEINLEYCKLQSLPQEIENLVNLHTLSLGYNQLHTIGLGKLINLQELYLNDNLLGTIEPDLGKLTNLCTLGLENNQLYSLPSTIVNLTNLQILDLSHNKLDSIPLVICSLINLQELYLSKNYLELLPSEICNLINLKRLGLDDNQLCKLPETICMLTNLQYLDLCDNRLEILPSRIDNLVKLTTFYLYNNLLNELPPFIENLIH